eukprot:TRINITY_DN8506_c0_g1_i4.p2 TRINITY_DN8506_c0_g1~~TRINITY_DN8506_c0_g1_i4.p2  ORF type:complete len:508 (-),score=161.36 TRINITY_DN8506_c0_g1_i4:50-1573(-)
MEVMTVKDATRQIRPFVVCAILRGVKFNEKSYDSFIQLQEKLHQNICRERTLVAIGTHDLDTIQGPFSYEARAPHDIKFIPLKETELFTAGNLLRYYEEEKEQSPLKKYVPIIKHSPVYPVIYDSKKRVLSLPPIINGDHSKITLKTRNVFIECTATDHTKAEIVLNTVISSFSGISESVEAVKVVYESTKEEKIYPNLSTRAVETDLNYLNQGIGINVTRKQAIDLLRKMDMDAVEGKDNTSIIVNVPPTRPDVLHVIDIQEDLAIAYGYNNIVKTIPRSMTIGKEQPLNWLTDLVREGVAQAGFLEVLTWAMTSKRDNFANMLLADNAIPAVTVVPGTSKQSEFEIIRTSLIPGLLKTIGANRGRTALPIDIFEASDICLMDDVRDTGSKNERRLAALHCGKTSGFEVVHGLLDRIMTLFAIPFEVELLEEKKGEAAAVAGKGYRLVPLGEHHVFKPSFFPGLVAEIYIKGKYAGVLGVIHPEVLGKFEIDAPCSVLEINLEILL